MWLRLNMTEKLFTGTLNTIKKKKKKKKKKKLPTELPRPLGQSYNIRMLF